MKCETAEDLVQNYLDLSLSHEQRISLEKHVELCSNCREELKAYKHLLELFELEDQGPDLPADFTVKVMSSLPEVDFGVFPGPHAWFSARIAKVTSLVAAVLIVIGIVGVQWVSWDPSPQQKPEVTAQVNPTKQGTTNIFKTPSNVAEIAKGNEELNVSSQLILKVNGGIVHVSNSDGYHLIKDGQQHALAFRDEINTGVNASASIIYPEGDIQLKLKPVTKIKIARNSLQLYHGSSWVNIIKKGTNFEVKTPNLIAAVRGTIFTVSEEGIPSGSTLMPSLKTRSTVSVFEGLVEVRSLIKGQPPELVEASRQVSSLTAGLSGVTDVGEDVLSKWRLEIESEPSLRAIQIPGSGSKGNNPEIHPGQSFSKELGR